MATIELTVENFESEIRWANMVVVEFWGEGCGPCHRFAPVFERASERHAGVVFGKVDIATEQPLAEAFSILGIPTVMVVRNNVIVHYQQGGLDDDALEELITRTRRLSINQVRAAGGSPAVPLSTRPRVTGSRATDSRVAGSRATDSRVAGSRVASSRAIGAPSAIRQSL